MKGEDFVEKAVTEVINFVIVFISNRETYFKLH